MTSKPGIIYLQKDRFQLFSPFLRQVVEFRFVPEIVRDSDVINPELLESLIKVFVTNTKIPPSNLSIVLADNAYFVKDFVLPPQPKTPQQAQQPQITMETLNVMSMDFIEHVPFESVVSKSIPLKDGIRVCAVNKDFFDAIKNSFAKLGFTIDGVYPGFVLGNNLSAKPVLDNVLVSSFFQKVGTLKQYDLLQQEVYKPEAREGTETSVEVELEDFEEKNKKPDKKRLYMMVGVLGLLVIVLVVVYIQSQNQPPPLPPQQPTANTQAAPPPAAAVDTAPIVTEAIVTSPNISSTSVTASNLAVQITNTGNSTADAQTLREAFSKFSFKTLTVGNDSNSSTSTTVVTFSSNVNQQVRNAVLEEMRKVKTNVTVQERQTGEYDITIILGQ
jgi:hypothetical protein